MSLTSGLLVLLNVCWHKLWKILAWNILTFNRQFNGILHQNLTWFQTTYYGQKISRGSTTARYPPSPIAIWEDVYYSILNTIGYYSIFPYLSSLCTECASQCSLCTANFLLPFWWHNATACIYTCTCTLGTKSQ